MLQAPSSVVDLQQRDVRLRIRLYRSKCGPKLRNETDFRDQTLNLSKQCDCTLLKLIQD